MPTVSELISQILLKKLREEELTPQEAATLAEWEGRSPEHAAFIDMLMDEASLSDRIKSLLEVDEQAAWQRIERALEAEWNERSVPKRKIAWYKYAAAASVIALLAYGVFYFMTSKPPVSDTSKATKPATVADIAPGGNRAELTLADGSVIDLDKAQNGLLATKGESKVEKTEDGKLVYVGQGLASDRYNTLKTPRGGEYQVTLPDGSRVWLNAASSIKYPLAFTAGERKIELTGEAYFEVAKDLNKKFIAVIKNNKGETRGEVEVLGTHFNVQAYDEDNLIAASLVEGSIRMSASQAGASTVLSPGQQAQLTPDNTLKVLYDVDMDGITAWKNGRIDFKSVSLKTIMNAVSRWYNVDVLYEGNIEKKSGFNGGISRNTSMTELISILATFGIICELENGVLVVRPGEPN